jgi:Zn-dependent M16 (insulinase) family peptidase
LSLTAVSAFSLYHPPKKDFYNLTNVYMDAVFFPRAVDDPTVLAQEGW